MNVRKRIYQIGPVLTWLVFSMSVANASPFFEAPKQEPTEPTARFKTAGKQSAAVASAPSVLISFAHRHSGGEKATILQQESESRWQSQDGRVDVVSTALESGFELYTVSVSREISGFLDVSVALALESPQIFSTFVEYDYSKERTNIARLSDAFQWLEPGITKMPYTPVLGIENRYCGVELVMPSNHHEDGASLPDGIEIQKDSDKIQLHLTANLDSKYISKGESLKFQFALHRYCEHKDLNVSRDVVVYPYPSTKRVSRWLSPLQDQLDVMTFVHWKNFPALQVGSPVVDQNSDAAPAFKKGMEELDGLGIKPVLYGAAHAISSLDPKLGANVENWASDKSVGGMWTQFKGSRLQPITLETESVRSHILAQYKQAWAQGYTDSAYLDLAMPTRAQKTVDRAYQIKRRDRKSGLYYTPLLHYWSFLRELSSTRDKLAPAGKILTHSGIPMPRFLSRHVDYVLVGEPLWREFESRGGNKSYEPDYNALPTPLAQIFWEKKTMGQPVLMPMLSGRYLTKKHRNKEKPARNRELIESESRDLVRFLLRTGMQLWASGVDEKVVQDHLEAMAWLGGFDGSTYCVFPIRGKGAIGLRRKAGKSVGYVLEKPTHWNASERCAAVSKAERELLNVLANTENPSPLAFRVGDNG